MDPARFRVASASAGSRANKVADTSRIFLIGPMGTGKTTIGSQLAHGLKFAFVDSDQELEARTGASISLIFDVEGEAGFRERECKIIDELTQRNDVVVATGGGVVMRPENCDCLSQRGFVIYLKSPVEALIQRVRFDQSRPLLRTVDPEQTLRDLMVVREPLYSSIADFVIDTGALTVKQVIKKIMSQLS
jgi:shikimate kinase